MAQTVCPQCREKDPCRCARYDEAVSHRSGKCTCYVKIETCALHGGHYVPFLNTIPNRDGSSD